MKVMVYYNLHKQCLSVKALEGAARGRVLFHAQAVQLKSAVFKVSQAGRLRVLRERSKNVHAGVVGELISHDAVLPDGTTALLETATQLGLNRALTYDPYRFTSFVDRDTHAPVYQAPECVIVGRRVLVPASPAAELEH